MTDVLGILFAATAGLLALAPSPMKRLSRLDVRKRPALAKGVEGPVAEESRSEESRRRRLLLSAAAGVLSGSLTGGLPGLAVGALTGWGCWWWTGRGESAGSRKRRARMVADLPMAVELLAACLAAGVSWAESVEAVSGALGGPLGADLEKVAAQIRLGADPPEAWRELTENPETAPLARAAARTAQSGAALAPVLNRLARDQRRTARAAAEARARSAAIQAVAPLGLCFLPAFFFLGIVPSVAGIAQSITLP